MPAADSPAVTGSGFRPIDASSIGPSPSAFAWDAASLATRDGRGKVQAERYQRMRGLWRTGSYCIEGLALGKGFLWAPEGAWARYDNVRVTPPCRRVVLRCKGHATNVSVATEAPGNVVARLSIPASLPDWTLLEAPLRVTPGSPHTVTVFLLFDGPISVDYFYFSD